LTNLVHQRRRLQGVIDPFVAEVSSGPVSQFLVDERHQLVAGREVSGRPGVQQLAHCTCVFTHAVASRRLTIPVE
jgi:hypothetical protein